MHFYRFEAAGIVYRFSLTRVTHGGYGDDCSVFGLNGQPMTADAFTPPVSTIDLDDDMNNMGRGDQHPATMHTEYDLLRFVFDGKPWEIPARDLSWPAGWVDQFAVADTGTA